MLAIAQACPIFSIETYQQLHITAGNIPLLRKIIYRTVSLNHQLYPELTGTLSLMAFNGMSRVELILIFSSFSPPTVAHMNQDVLYELADFYTELSKVLATYGTTAVLPYLRYQEEITSSISQAKYPVLFFMSQAYAIQYPDGKYRNLVSRTRSANADELLAQVLTPDQSSKERYADIKKQVTRGLSQEQQNDLQSNLAYSNLRKMFQLFLWKM